ncbi:hypothetical protein BGZ60DRAFT_426711 [Tricladium varicosporioides]|nr:hypothetical protein BGZ60DRAFT_426711 [Hymenoscyphus varicosporioides]
MWRNPPRGFNKFSGTRQAAGKFWFLAVSHGPVVCGTSGSGCDEELSGADVVDWVSAVESRGLCQHKSKTLQDSAKQEKQERQEKPERQCTRPNVKVFQGIPERLVEMVIPQLELRNREISRGSQDWWHSRASRRADA